MQPLSETGSGEGIGGFDLVRASVQPSSQVRPLVLERFFTYEGKSPFEYDIYGNPLSWVTEEVKVTDDMGKVIFVQPNVKRPDFWSPLAIKVVASKYFWGDQAKGEREHSVEQLIGRVARYTARQALKQGYLDLAGSERLRDEVAAICLSQMAVFNSPVWFNAGTNQEYDRNAGGVSAWKWDAATDSIVHAERSDDRPQCSACFIQSIEDNMDSIMALQQSEAMLFKAGSGTGTNRSPLRSSKEKLTGGGRASGPVSFMKGYDAYAGIIKSGGKTRRAAKMEILNVDHPDVIEFIESKQKEEKKAWALIEQGYSGGLNGEAYSSIAFQNCNMSVRAPDSFMEAVKHEGDWQTRFVSTAKPCETFKAKEIMHKIAEGTWICGDPGVQFDTTVNTWHTCKNSGRINASNPCVTGDTRVLSENGTWRRIDSLLEKPTTILTNTGFIQASAIKGSFKTGEKPVYTLSTESGYELKLTGDHKVFTVNRGFVSACELTKDDLLLIPNSAVAPLETIDEKDQTLYQLIGVYLGDGCGGTVNANRGIQITMHKEQEASILQKFAAYVAENYERQTHKLSPATVQLTQTSGKYVVTNTTLIQEISRLVNISNLSHQKCLSDAIFALPLGAQKYVLQGLFSADGTVANYGDKSQYVALDSTSLQLLKDVQLMLLGFGIRSKLYKNRRAGKSTSLLPDGKGGLKEYTIREMYSLRISRSSRHVFQKLIGFMSESPKQKALERLNVHVESYRDVPFERVASLVYEGVQSVYDLTEPITHSFVANGITIHNCSEYMFLDDSACNLASINLMRFRTEEGKFDVERFKRVVRTFSLAMELFVDGSSYPTAKIARNSHDYRPLGLGYANLGALLMSLGLPYDSDEGRAVAAAVTAIMCGEAYRMSAEVAHAVGPFPGFARNREPMLEVMRMHRDAVKKIEVNKIPSDLRYLVNEAWDCWDDAVRLGEIYGYRNSQMTVLAPTGTIAFMMDCDTTGVEPDIALVKYKVLAGGGMLKIVNRSVPLALKTLGYSPEAIQAIVNYIDANDTIEGAAELRDEHLAIFDCAFKAAKGKRYIHHRGHIKMMGVTQPFVSGAISKTVNMPEHTTVDDIAETYVFAWEQGLKAVAIYRENSKRSQPLNTQKTEGERVKKEATIESISERRRLPQTRKSVTHKFDITGHEGYITVGLYDDGSPGEIFVTMSKQGSTIRGLMDSWATSVSLNLQYGIPVDILFNKFRYSKFEPAGFVKNVNGGELDEKAVRIRNASSIVDYVAQFMLNNFGPGAGKVEFEIKTMPEIETIEEQKTIKDFGLNEGIVCPLCGGPAKRIGNCAITCNSCNQTTRSGCGE